MARDFFLIDVEKNRIEFLDSRFYRHEQTGDFYPSVTTILESYPKTAQFYEWLKKVGDDADEIRDEAGRKGSIVHQLTEDYDNGKECSMLSGNGSPLYKQLEWAMFERYVDFRTRYNFELVSNELHYVSQLFGFGGTLDRVFKYNGELWLIDIKTSNTVYDHYWLQVAAYAAMFEEHNSLEINKIGILHLKANTRTIGGKDKIQGIGWKLYEPEYSREHYFTLFQCTHQLWNEQNKNIKPKNTIYQLKHKIEKP